MGGGVWLQPLFKVRGEPGAQPCAFLQRCDCPPVLLWNARNTATKSRLSVSDPEQSGDAGRGAEGKRQRSRCAADLWLDRGALCRSLRRCLPQAFNIAEAVGIAFDNVGLPIAKFHEFTQRRGASFLMVFAVNGWQQVETAVSELHPRGISPPVLPGVARKHQLNARANSYLLDTLNVKVLS